MSREVMSGGEGDDKEAALCDFCKSFARRNGCISMVAVRGGIGSFFGEAEQEALSFLGAGERLVGAGERGYVLLSHGGKALHEFLTGDESIAVFNGRAGGHAVSLSSVPLHCGDASSLMVDGKEYSVNTPGINIALYDLGKGELVESVGFDTGREGIPFRRKGPGDFDVDGRFARLAEELIRECRLGVDGRTGLVRVGGNIGDTYFMVSVVSYVQRKKGKRYVMIAPEDSPLQTFARWHRAGGADIEQRYATPGEWEILEEFWARGSASMRKRYAGKLDYFDWNYDHCAMFNGSRQEDIYLHMTRPRLPDLDKAAYIGRGIVPGRTVFVMPGSHFGGTMPRFFWDMSVGLFRLLGYTVAVNTPEGAGGYEGAVCLFPPLDDLVGLCDLCGTVYCMRSGLAELVAAESTARIFCFGHVREGWSVLRSILKIYPHAGRHLTEIPVGGDRESFPWIRAAMEERERERDFLRGNIVLRDAVLSLAGQGAPMREAGMQFHAPGTVKRILGVQSPRRVPAFCSARYHMRLERNVLVFHMEIEPMLDYEIHVGVRDITRARMAGECHYYNHVSFLYELRRDGYYTVIVHIVHPETGENGIFRTVPVAFGRN